MKKARFETVWLSDLHLGTRGCRAEELVQFLDAIRPRTLYLVGDVLDMWRLRQRWYWPTAHNEVIRQILELAKKGVEVIFVPGNHDEAVRQYAGLDFGGVLVRLQDEHHTLDGRKLLVSHGDEFDLVVKHSPWLGMLGNAAYELLIGLNRLYNQGRALLGMRYWSLSQYVKLKVKTACTFISRFEDHLVDEARRRGCDGVVCGHIHKAEAATRGRGAETIAYYNCGDWVESCTALVEHEDGTIEVIDGLAFLEARQAAQAGTAAAAPVAVGAALAAELDEAEVALDELEEEWALVG